MRLFGVVALDALAHGSAEFRRQGVLRCFAFGEFVAGAVEIIADVLPPRIVAEIVGAGDVRFLLVVGVIQGEVAVGAFHIALCVDVPGQSEVLFAGHVHARIR